MVIDEHALQNNPLFQAALEIARLFPVFPVHTQFDGSCSCGKPDCEHIAKHPLTAHGHKDATQDIAKLKQWWTEAPPANIGVATGNGLLVLDADIDGDGEASLSALEAEHGELPKGTPTVRTGSGGRQIYLAYDPARATLKSRNRWRSGLDIRADGGYVIAPPSLHKSGKRYQYLVPFITPIALAPEWLVKLLQTPEAFADSQIRTAPTNDKQKTGIRLVVQADSDLRSHPGVSEGERNATLCHLIGVHLDRGDAHDDIEAWARAWAKRCSPAYSEDNAAKTLDALWRKHHRNGSAQAASVKVCVSQPDENLPPLPPPKQKPVLSPEALHGIIGEVVQAWTPHTEADPVALLLNCLVAFGSCVGRRAFFRVRETKHHTNLFAVAVGKSAHGRKGEALDIALSMFDETWRKDCITHGLSSGEELLWCVRDEQQKFKEGGFEVIDPGVSDKRLLVIESEFAQTLRILRREGNTLSPIIRNAWDRGDLRSMTKNSPLKATDGHVSILANITNKEFEKSLSDTEAYNGFGNRFLYAGVERSQLLPDGGEHVDMTPQKQLIAKAVAKAKGIGEMKRSPEAASLWRELYPLLAQERPGLYGAMTSRGEGQTLRLSMVYALIDGVPIIGVDHLQAAYAVWRYCEESARLIFGESDAGNALAWTIHKSIVASAGISRTEISQALGGHSPAHAIADALAWLRDNGMAHCMIDAASSARRKPERWYPGKVTANLGTCEVSLPTISNESANSQVRGDDRQTQDSGMNSQIRSSDGCEAVVAPIALSTLPADAPTTASTHTDEVIHAISGVPPHLRPWKPDPAWYAEYLKAQEKRKQEEKERMGSGDPIDEDHDFLPELRAM